MNNNVSQLENMQFGWGGFPSNQEMEDDTLYASVTRQFNTFSEGVLLLQQQI